MLFSYSFFSSFILCSHCEHLLRQTHFHVRIANTQKRSLRKIDLFFEDNSLTTSSLCLGSGQVATFYWASSHSPLLPRFAFRASFLGEFPLALYWHAPFVGHPFWASSHSPLLPCFACRTSFLGEFPLALTGALCLPLLTRSACLCCRASLGFGCRDSLGIVGLPPTPAWGTAPPKPRIRCLRRGLTRVACLGRK